MCETFGGVVENVDAAALVARSSHFAIGGDIDGHAEGTFGGVSRDLLHGCCCTPIGCVKGGGVIDIDTAIRGGDGEVLSVLVQRWRPVLTGCRLLVRGHDGAFGLPLPTFVIVVPYS